MKEQNVFNNRIASVKEAIDQGKLVVFVGAGISVDSGIPVWTRLINSLKKYLDENQDEEDPLVVAQLLYAQKGQREYNEIVKKELFKNKTTYNKLHELIFKLNPQHIVTTNYDSFLEDVVKDEGLPFSLVSKDQDLPYTKHSKLLIKFHGSFEDHNIVLKKDDYDNFQPNNPLKDVYVKSLFSNKVILFVGYSVSDPNLEILIRQVKDILKNDHQKNYLISADTSIDKSKIDFYDSLGINVIQYNSDELKSNQETKSLSDKGNMVSKMFQYILEFDVFNYRLSGNDTNIQFRLINELYDSLIRYKYFKVLPQKFITDLNVFSENSKNNYLIDGNTLKCFNSDLYEYFDALTLENRSTLPAEIREKTDYIIQRLIFSDIFKIGKPGRSDSFGNVSVTDEIDLRDKIKINNCNCINCLLDRYEINKAIIEIHKYSINEKTDLQDDLIYANGLYRVHDFYKSYQAFKSIIVKANRRQRFDISFLCKYNLKRLRGYIQNDYFENRLEYEAIESINKEVDTIDLDEDLLRVKHFIDKDLYFFLRNLKQGDYIRDLSNSIDNIYVKVPKTVKNITSGGSESNSVFYNLYREAKKLKFYLNYNFIIGASHTAVPFVLLKAVNTFVLGLHLKEIEASDQQRMFGIPHISEVDAFIFSLIIEYSNSKDLHKLFKENNIDEIKISKNSEGEIVSWIRTFFRNSIKTNSGFGIEERPNLNFIYYINLNRTFKRYYIEKVFNNMCLGMTFFNFKLTTFQLLYSELNKFLEHVVFSEGEFPTQLNRLIVKKHKQIKVDDLLKTLSILEEKNLTNLAYHNILRLLKNRNKRFIYADFNLEKYDIARNSNRFDYVYFVLDKEKKKKFKVKLQETLDRRKDTNLYTIALYEKILTSKKVIKDYKSLIKPLLEIDRSEKKYVHRDWLDNQVINFFSMSYDGVLDLEGFDKNKIIEEKFKFFYSPEDYDESVFDVRWLEDCNYSTFYKRYVDIDFIYSKLEDYLKSNDNPELSKFYFKLLSTKKQQSN